MILLSLSGCSHEIQSPGLSSSNEPLYLLDFEPVTNVNELDAIDPIYIESVTVIKDSEKATKMFGNQAKNGVIVVITKHFSPTKAQQQFLWHSL